MADILLIHGSNHGAWCWRDVIPRLAAQAHSVRAIDLPGLGADRTPPERADLDACIARIGEALGDRTILVGHSLGGVSITQAAEPFADRIARLVYVAAWVPADGEAARDLRERYGCRALLDATRIAPDRLTSSFAEETLETLFYHDCPEEARAYARPRLRPQPLSVGGTPLQLTARSATVPRSYVRCLADRAIPAAAQADLSGGWDDVHSIDCGHSPFFAAPDKLSGILDRIAGYT